MKTKTLHVDVRARVSIDYSDEELEQMGKTFREFKAGVERVIASELIPVFQADPHTKVEVMTVGFPTRKTVAKSMSKRDRKVAQILHPDNFKKDKEND